MENENELIKWVKSGKQKSAFVKALRKPMTSKEIWDEGRNICPSMRIQDVWHLLKSFEKQKLVYRLTRKYVTGTIVFFTDKGRGIVQEAFGFAVNPFPLSIKWQKYSKVVRAKVRKAVLLELNRSYHQLGHSANGKTATMIRKGLLERYPLGLNMAIKAVKELESIGLLECAGVTRKGNFKLYRITDEGRRIADQVLA